MPKLTLYKHSILFYPERFMHLILWKWIKLQYSKVSLLHIRITRENYRTLMPGPHPSPVKIEFLELETWYQNLKDLPGDSNSQTRLRTSGFGCCCECIVLIHFPPLDSSCKAQLTCHMTFSGYPSSHCSHPSLNHWGTCFTHFALNHALASIVSWSLYGSAISPKLEYKILMIRNRICTPFSLLPLTFNNHF